MNKSPNNEVDWDIRPQEDLITPIGIVMGALVGTTMSTASEHIVDKAVATYKNTGIATPSNTRFETDYPNIGNNAESAAMVAPIFLMAAVGAAIARKFHKINNI